MRLLASVCSAVDQNKANKRRMEDAVAVEAALAPDVAFFGVYDGHAGADVADMLADELHGVVAERMAGGAGAVPRVAAGEGRPGADGGPRAEAWRRSPGRR